MQPRSSVLLLIGTFLTCSVLAVPQRKQAVQFSDATATSGIDFRHENGASPQKYLPETMSGGVVIFDYDRDGWPDVFFVNGGSYADASSAVAAGHRLYHNDQNGKFSDRTEASGIGVSGFGMGGCSADYDNNGSTDLLLTGVGFMALYENRGDGNFKDVTEEAGVQSRSWNTSCAFGDIDNDGDVDLYVARYVNFSVDEDKYCSLPGVPDVRSYCHPNEYRSVPDVLFRNNGDGTFSDITRESGVFREEGNGLGVVFGDYDDDGWTDIYVANDSTPNFLFHNIDGKHFEEIGFLAGVAVGSAGQPQAGMGTDMGDYDGNGLPDILATNLNQETHSLYRNMGKGLFNDATFASGLAEATLPFVGFGTAFLDFDNDGDLDLATANGHVIDNIALAQDTTYEQLNLLLQNDGAGKFKNVGPDAGTGFAIRKASRGLAVGDLDNDGDLDIVISNSGNSADFLKNEFESRSNALLVKTVGTKSNRDGIGARLKLFVRGKMLSRDVRAGSGYLSQSDLRVHFGLGQAGQADRLEVHWPGGAVDVIEKVQANRILTIREGAGIVSSELLPGAR